MKQFKDVKLTCIWLSWLFMTVTQWRGQSLHCQGGNLSHCSHHCDQKQATKNNTSKTALCHCFMGCFDASKVTLQKCAILQSLLSEVLFHCRPQKSSNHNLAFFSLSLWITRSVLNNIIIKKETRYILMLMLMLWKLVQWCWLQWWWFSQARLVALLDCYLHTMYIILARLPIDGA